MNGSIRRELPTVENSPTEVSDATMKSRDTNAKDSDVDWEPPTKPLLEGFDENKKNLANPPVLVDTDAS